MSTTFRFSLDQYDRMIEQGIFDEYPEQRLELINGEIHPMNPPGPIHEYVIDLLADWSIRSTARDEVLIRIQNSIGLPELESAPQPDIAWVAAKSYRSGRPQTDDVFLVIEVSDSSLRFDRNIKLELYANAGVQDYWIVDLPHECIEVFREPRDGRYGQSKAFGIDAVVSPLRFPDVQLDVARLFGRE